MRSRIYFHVSRHLDRLCSGNGHRLDPGSQFLVVSELRRSGATVPSSFRIHAKACARAAHHPDLRDGPHLKGGNRSGAHGGRLLSDYVLRGSRNRSRRRKAVLFAGSHALASVLQIRHPRRAVLGYFGCGSTWSRIDGAVVGEFIASEHGLGRTILYAGETSTSHWYGARCCCSPRCLS